MYANINIHNENHLFSMSVTSTSTVIVYMSITVEPLSNDHPHQRPSLLYDHISCDGQCFLFVRSLTDDHPSNATSDRVRWNFLPRGRPHRVFQNDCRLNVRCRAAHFTIISIGGSTKTNTKILRIACKSG